MKKSEKIALIISTIIIVVVLISAIPNFSFGMKPFVYSSTKGKQQRYIDWITPHAKRVGSKYGIPYEAIIVQTALETGWGKSSLLTKYNNFGGIKSVAGDKSVTLGTVEYINGNRIEIEDGFAVFRSPKEGLEAYGNFFHKNARYAHALNYPNDPYIFLSEIKKAGYATDLNYISKVHGMLNTYYS